MRGGKGQGWLRELVLATATQQGQSGLTDWVEQELGADKHLVRQAECLAMDKQHGRSSCCLCNLRHASGASGEQSSFFAMFRKRGA
jgi:hypothetical protein